MIRGPFFPLLVNDAGWGQMKPPTTYPLATYALYTCSSYGPTFRGGHDVYIADVAKSNTNSYSNLGYNYNQRSDYNVSDSFNQSLLAGSYNFRVYEVEVFYKMYHY